MSDSLPDPEEARWTVKRKAAVVREIDAGRLSSSEACRRYGLSYAELDRWIALHRWGGQSGLRLKCTRAYRSGRLSPT